MVGWVFLVVRGVWGMSVWVGMGRSEGGVGRAGGGEG